MASKPIQKSALTSHPGNIKSIILPVILSPADALLPRERIDVRPEFIDFKIASMTQEQLIDTLGLVKRAGKELEKWEKLAIDVVKAKAELPTVKGGETVLPGDLCKAVIVRSEPRRIDQEKLIAKFGEEALEDCYSEKPQYTLNIKPNV